MVFRVHRAGFKAAALVSIATFGIVGCGSSGSKSGRHAAGPVSDSVLKIGFFGALTGPGAQIGVSIKNGELLAISQYDATNPPVRVTLDPFDSQGVKSDANSGATKLIDDGVVAIIGPAFPAESDVADPIFEEAGIPNVSASATEGSLGQHGWKYFHRVVADDSVQGVADADYLVKTLGLKKIAVLDDSSAYGRGLAESVRLQAQSDGAAVVVSDHIDPNAADYGAPVAKVLSGDADAVFFGGYYDAAARLINQLKGKAFSGAFMSGDGSDDPAFVKDAGGAPAEGAYLSCACADISNNANAQPFSAAYRAQFGFAPSTYSAEAYDATDAVLQAIKSGATTPSTINRYLATINYEGVTKAIKFQPNGNIAASTIYMYQVKDGQIVPIGTHS